MTSYQLKERVIDLKNVTNEQRFNEIDDLFTKALMKATSAVEGPTRTLPYSEKKLEVSNLHLHWKLKVKMIQGKRIDVERMLRRKEVANVEDNTTTMTEAKQQLANAKKMGIV